MRLAMIGTGGIAARHLHAITAMGDPSIQIVAHVSRKEASARDAAERWGGLPFTSVPAMLAQVKPDAAFICTIPSDHGATELALINAGVPFFVEKPLDTNGSVAPKIARALARRKLFAAVGYHWRAMDTIAELRTVLAAKPPRMVLASWHDSTPPPAWWCNQAQSGGQMVEQATHLFDIARTLVGEATVLSADASRIHRERYADANVADVSAALVRYKTGATGVFTTTCLLNHGASIQVQFVCDGMLITLNQSGVTYDDGREARFVPCRNDPVLDEDRAFIEAVRTGEASGLYCTYADALATHALCCRVQKLATKKRP